MEKPTMSAKLPHPPTPSRGGLSRSPTTMWDLMVWAYAREMVRVYAGRNDGGRLKLPGSSSSSTSSAMDALAYGAVIRGSGPSDDRIPCHEDALTLHGAVVSMANKSEDYWLLVNAAEQMTPPEWDREIADIRYEPVLSRKGQRYLEDLMEKTGLDRMAALRGMASPAQYRPRHYETVYPYKHRNDIFAIEVASTGHTAEDKQLKRITLRKNYKTWHQLMRRLCTHFRNNRAALNRWTVTDIGAPAAPWRQRGAQEG